MSLLYQDLANTSEVLASPAQASGAHAANHATNAADAKHPGFYRSVGKRALDVVLIVLALPFVLPVLLILMALVMTDGGRPLYSQDRVGLHGRIYRIWKVRSMVMNADQKLEAHLAADPAARAEWSEMQKLRLDPRITAVGGLIRKSSLDELPQLFNVLIGDMSLVGPRPMMPDQRALYPGLAYYDLRPGITGPWQVSERNATSFADRARFDDRYHADLSLATDVRLLASTVKVVLRATGC
jgi:lipopolysaccharide/colanic/teichoic acid biosynthesis glycosyltransferase